MAKVFVENLPNKYEVGELPYNTFFLWNDELFMKIYSPDYVDNADYCAVWNFNNDEEGELHKETKVRWMRCDDVEIRVLKRG
jgi:thioredoxin-related protein